MCNLYSMTRSRDAIRQIAQAMNDSLGNLPELPGVYPDYLAPIVKLDQRGQREIVLARWDWCRSRTRRRRRSPTKARLTCAIRGSRTGRATLALSTGVSCRSRVLPSPEA